MQTDYSRPLMARSLIPHLLSRNIALLFQMPFGKFQRFHVIAKTQFCPDLRLREELCYKLSINEIM